MKFQNHYNSRDFDRGYEKNDLPSETVPNQSLTVRELVYRFTHNMDLNSTGRLYDDDDEVQLPANWNKLDISEKMSFLNEKRDEAQALVDKVQARKNAEEKAKRDKFIAEQVQLKLDAHVKAIQNKKGDAQS